MLVKMSGFLEPQLIDSSSSSRGVGGLTAAVGVGVEVERGTPSPTKFDAAGKANGHLPAVAHQQQHCMEMTAISVDDRRQQERIAAPDRKLVATASSSSTQHRDG